MRLLRLTLAAALTALALPGLALAADNRIASDSHVIQVRALGSTVLYQRIWPHHRSLARTWMVFVDGKLRAARNIPRRAVAGDLGRDSRGRLVFTFGTRRHSTGARDWWIYDVRRRRARRMERFPPRGCGAASAVSVWRRRLAFEADCPKGRSGTFVRDGKRTRRVSASADSGQPVLRGGSLATILDSGDNSLAYRFMSRGRVCGTRVPAGEGSSDSWLPVGVGLTGERLVWVMQAEDDSGASPSFTYTVLAAEPGSRCAVGRVGTFSFRPRTSGPLRAAIDGRSLVYTDGSSVYSHRLPARPSYAAPSNDDFEYAAALPSTPPVSVRGVVGNATRQPGEPELRGATRTVWYAYRPAVTQRVYVQVANGWAWDVFTGSSFADLAPVPRTQFAAIDAVAGHTYWIAVGTGGHLWRQFTFEPFGVSITLTPPPTS